MSSFGSGRIVGPYQVKWLKGPAWSDTDSALHCWVIREQRGSSHWNTKYSTMLNTPLFQWCPLSPHPPCLSSYLTNSMDSPQVTPHAQKLPVRACQSMWGSHTIGQIGKQGEWGERRLHCDKGVFHIVEYFVLQCVIPVCSLLTQ